MARTRDVFLSKPNALNAEQSAFCNRLQEILSERGLRARTLGETDYPNEAPVAAVKTVLRDCDGAIILGLAQLRVGHGVLKAGTEAEKSAAGTIWPTAWNHIEAGMAFAMGVPLLVIREDGVAGGVFDVGSTDRFVHQAPMSADWLAGPRFLQPFNDWLEELRHEADPPHRTRASTRTV